MLKERVSKMIWKGFSMNPNSWMENPALSGIDPAKLQLLTSLAGQAQGKSQNELLPFLMSAASGQLSFDPTENWKISSGNPADRPDVCTDEAI